MTASSSSLSIFIIIVIITDALSTSIRFDLVIEKQLYEVTAPSGHSHDQWALEFFVPVSDPPTSITPPIHGEPQHASDEIR